MRYLKVIGNYINIDQTIYICVDSSEEEGKVTFCWKDTNGTVHTQTLIRKETVIAEPLTADEVRRALFRALDALSDTVCTVDICDYFDKEEDKE